MAATGRWGAVRPNVAFSGLARLRRVKPQPKLFQAPGPARSGHRCLFYARATAADEESESSPVVQEVDGKLLSLSPDDVSAGAARYAAVIEPPLYTRPSTEEELHQLRSAVGGGSAATQLVEFEEPTNFGEVCSLPPGPRIQTVSPGPTFRTAHCPGCAAVAVQFRWVRVPRRKSRPPRQKARLPVARTRDVTRAPVDVPCVAVGRPQDAVWGGSKVSVHGSFNDWQQARSLANRSSRSQSSCAALISVPLPPSSGNRA